MTLDDLFTKKEDETYCPICKNEGFIYHTIEPHSPPMATVCDCQKIRSARLRIKNSGISKEFYDKTFTNFDTMGDSILANAKDIAMDYATHFLEIKETPNNSILFCGQCGSGKTHLTMAIANAIMETHRKAVIYMQFRPKIRELKSLSNTYNEYQKEMKILKDTDCLLIDDLLKGKITDADINPLFEIINDRYFRGLPTIISTEKTPSELKAYDEATMGRIIERSQGHIVVIQGKQYDYRLKNLGGGIKK